MNAGFVQSTLRELKLFAASKNLWLTFGAVVMLFVVTGPFGTLQIPFLQRFSYWLVLHAVAWTTTIVVVVMGDCLLQRVIPSRFWRYTAGAALAAVPLGAILQVIDALWFGEHVTLQAYLTNVLQAAPLCIIFCVISYMTMSPANTTQTVHAQIDQPAPERPIPDNVAVAPPLLNRLKPENRGTLQHVTVEDHYTLVVTSRGRELILLRFGDAIREAGDKGMQVHRSHWVSADFVASLNRSGGRLMLRLKDGTEIPVSRTYATEVRNRFA